MSTKSPQWIKINTQIYLSWLELCEKRQTYFYVKVIRQIFIELYIKFTYT